jgi:hypothetical protein
VSAARQGYRQSRNTPPGGAPPCKPGTGGTGFEFRFREGWGGRGGGRMWGRAVPTPTLSAVLRPAGHRGIIQGGFKGVLPKAKSGKNSAHAISRAHEKPSNFIGFNVAVPEDPPSLKLQRAGGHPAGLGQRALKNARKPMEAHSPPRFQYYQTNHGDEPSPPQYWNPPGGIIACIRNRCQITL